MQIRTFTIPLWEAGPAEDVLNRFLRGHRVLQIDRRFVEQGEYSCWAVWVEYLPGIPGASPDRAVGKTGRIDYREVLDEKAFGLFAKLRTLRKKLAADEAIPAYAVFTNEQLASMVSPCCRSIGDLRKIDGIGEARIEKYGRAVLELLNNEKDRKPDGPDHGDREPSGGISSGESGKEQQD